MGNGFCEAGWSRIPDSILLAVFGYLKWRDLAVSSAVTTQWHRVARDDSLWFRLFQSDFKKCHRRLPKPWDQVPSRGNSGGKCVADIVNRGSDKTPLENTPLPIRKSFTTSLLESHEGGGDYDLCEEPSASQNLKNESKLDTQGCLDGLSSFDKKPSNASTTQQNLESVSTEHRGKMNWLCEYKQLVWEAPVCLVQTLSLHDDEVLHVSFDPVGRYFATVSKDATLKLWRADDPCSLLVSLDLKAKFKWKYTQLCAFNEDGSLVLVSGVHFGVGNNTGEIAVFEVDEGKQSLGFRCRVINKPYDVFGCWYDQNHILNGELAPLHDLLSMSSLWLCKACQDTSSERTAVLAPLFNFINRNGSSVRMVNVCSFVSPLIRLAIEVAGKDEPLAEVIRDIRAQFGAQDLENLFEEMCPTNGQSVYSGGSTTGIDDFPSTSFCVKEASESIKLTPKDPTENVPSSKLSSSGSSFSGATSTTSYCDNCKYRHVNPPLPTAKSRKSILTKLFKFRLKKNRKKQRRHSGSTLPATSMPSVSSSFAGVRRNTENNVGVDEVDGGGASPSFNSGCTQFFPADQTNDPDFQRDNSPENPENLDVSDLDDDELSDNEDYDKNDVINETLSKDKYASGSAGDSATFAAHQGDLARSSSCTCICHGYVADRLLIYTRGTETYVPHQVAFKLIKGSEVLSRLNADVMPDDLRDEIYRRMRERRDQEAAALANSSTAELEDEILAGEEAVFGDDEGEDVQDSPPAGANHVAEGIAAFLQDQDFERQWDMPDHVIEMRGHITGLALSSDNRRLFINVRTWPEDCLINNPYEPPPLAQQIEVQVVNLEDFSMMDTVYSSHLAYTSNEDCFFMFLDAKDRWLTSGSEDKHAYLWDMKHTRLVGRCPHNSVVNAVAVNPTDPEMMVSVSDDHRVRVWRSRRVCQGLSLENWQLNTVGPVVEKRANE